MRKFTDYDLAYICYYAERISLAEIGVSFSPIIPLITLQLLINHLKQEKKFDYYKEYYIKLLE
ncbi:MAG: hypothetical protein QM671_24025 [Bacillus sp. (in: firmicutes)]|uniref:hypothetical protein n=1 Tax=Bacillus sp. TaxID=1409 RepID=UPI0039E59947